MIDALLEIVQDAQAEAIYRQVITPTPEPLLDERDWWHVFADGKMVKL